MSPTGTGNQYRTTFTSISTETSGAGRTDDWSNSLGDAAKVTGVTVLTIAVVPSRMTAATVGDTRIPPPMLKIHRFPNPKCI